MSNKPEGMTDEEWGELLFDCAMGPHGRSAPLWATVGLAVFLIILFGFALWQ